MPRFSTCCTQGVDGEMPVDMFICQVCGRDLCGACQYGARPDLTNITGYKGTGNVCKSCLSRLGLGLNAGRPSPGVASTELTRGKVTVAHLVEGQVAKVKLLDEQADQIQCGAVISEAVESRLSQPCQYTNHNHCDGQGMFGGPCPCKCHLRTDLHTQTAAKLSGVPESEITPEQREEGKRANFVRLYNGRYKPSSQFSPPEDYSEGPSVSGPIDFNDPAELELQTELRNQGIMNEPEPICCPTCKGELSASQGMVGERVMVCAVHGMVWEDHEDAIRRVI